MRRFAFILGLLLTLTAGVWSSALAAASEWCLHEAESAAHASDEHDCCRAKTGDSNEHHSESHDSSHATSHATPAARNRDQEAHAGMNCGGGGGGAGVSSTPETAQAAFGQVMQSCVECCAGGSGQSPATAVFVAPEQYKVKRAAGSDPAGASDLFASAPACASHPAPTQHAPPAPPGHRHILNGVFLI